jgi:ABC-type multidrug transport system ATPase subunit
MLEAIDITYSYPNGPYALRGVSFCVSPGEIVGMIGVNGAGRPRSSNACWPVPAGRRQCACGGETGERTREKLAYVSGEGASFSLYSRLKLGNSRGVLPALRDGKIPRLLRFFELPNRPVRHMSTGQRAQAELAGGSAGERGISSWTNPSPTRTRLPARTF